MRAIFLTLAFMLATMISANSQTIRFADDRLFFQTEVKYLCDDNDEVYGTFNIETNKKSYTVPYTIHQKGGSVIVYIEVIYDDKYNYPVGSLLPDAKNKYLNENEKFEIIGQLTFAMEAIYRNILMEAEYDCQ